MQPQKNEAQAPTGRMEKTFVKKPGLMNSIRLAELNVIGIGRFDGRPALAARNETQTFLFVIPPGNPIIPRTVFMPYLYRIRLEETSGLVRISLFCSMNMEMPEFCLEIGQAEMEECTYILSDEAPYETMSNTSYPVVLAGASSEEEVFVVLRSAENSVFMTDVPPHMAVTSSYRVATGDPSDFMFRIYVGLGYIDPILYVNT
ncbi:MAG: hypothetical protein HGB37_04300 [Candidatus Moranbacteria bacterium]|nr:hypothetical protein [Candidatus Moranbacteria bacterium]